MSKQKYILPSILFLLLLVLSYLFLPFNLTFAYEIEKDELGFDYIPLPKENFVSFSDTLIYPYFREKMRVPVFVNSSKFRGDFIDLVHESRVDMHLSFLNASKENYFEGLLNYENSTIFLSREQLIILFEDNVSVLIEDVSKKKERYNVNTLVRNLLFELSEGLFLKDYDSTLAIYIAPFNVRNLREYTLNYDGKLLDRTYVEFCRVMNYISAPFFYQRLTDIYIRGFFNSWKSGLHPEEQVLLLDTVGIAYTEEYKAIYVSTYEMNSGLATLSKTLLSGYLNNGGALVIGSNDTLRIISPSCIYFYDSITTKFRIRLNNEALISQYFLENRPIFSKIYVDAVNGKGENLFEDLRGYIKDPRDYNRYRRMIVFRFINILIKDAPKMAEYLNSSISSS
jgi:hypothetical protein